ncbi:protein-export chaperone SecB [Litoribrevibacter euphylliae]|uniref:Protein-export protein SecB n=1 Tax=Litoribrevibacter euphylliae TaxID=1834034 RepID=A0ABV7HI72_9GAMM
MAEENQAAQNAEQPQNAGFALQRIYLKDFSFESPRAPQVFQSQWKPQVHMDLNTGNAKVGDDLYEVVLTITLTAKQDDEVALLVEIKQAGIFAIQGLEGPRLAHALGAFCPNILFPYARETIDSMVTKGSLPPFMLAPVNFDAIFAEAMQRKQQEADQAEATH